MTTQQTLAADKRFRQALVLASRCGEWLPVESNDQPAYMIPSSDPGRYYYTTQHTCTCPDTAFRGTACKHRQAVLFVHLGTLAFGVNVNADHNDQQRRKPQAAIVNDAPPAAIEREAEVVAAKASDRYTEIFGTDDD